MATDQPRYPDESSVPVPPSPAVPPAAPTEEELPQQTLTEHLADLRRCLIISLAAVAVGFAVCYSVAEPLADILFAPLRRVLPPDASLIFTSYQEGFFFT